MRLIFLMLEPRARHATHKQHLGARGGRQQRLQLALSLGGLHQVPRGAAILRLSDVQNRKHDQKIQK